MLFKLVPWIHLKKKKSYLDTILSEAVQQHVLLLPIQHQAPLHGSLNTLLQNRSPVAAITLGIDVA